MPDALPPSFTGSAVRYSYQLEARALLALPHWNAGLPPTPVTPQAAGSVHSAHATPSGQQAIEITTKRAAVNGVAFGDHVRLAAQPAEGYPAAANQHHMAVEAETEQHTRGSDAAELLPLLDGDADQQTTDTQLDGSLQHAQAQPQPQQDTQAQHAAMQQNAHVQHAQGQPQQVRQLPSVQSGMHNPAEDHRNASTLPSGSAVSLILPPIPTAGAQYVTRQGAYVTTQRRSDSEHAGFHRQPSR